VPRQPASRVEAVVKLGGGVLQRIQHCDAVLAALREASTWRRLLVVPGGGPFADVVREVDRRLRLSDTAAHWMAVLAMDQYAHVVAARFGGAALIRDPGEIATALDAGRLPVLAPFSWLRAADPLPHSWDVTSDSIAAWIAGQLGARRLILVKPAGVRASRDAVDPSFAGTLPHGVDATIVGADQIDALRAAL
jgi:dihydroneopterin aldolase